MAKRRPSLHNTTPRVQAAFLGLIILVCAFVLPHITPVDPFARGILVLLLSLSSTILLTGFLKSTGMITETRYNVTGPAAIFLITASLLTYLTHRHVESELKRQDQIHQQERERIERDRLWEEAQRAREAERLAELARIAESERLAKEALVRQVQKLEQSRVYHAEITARLDVTRNAMDEALIGTMAAAERHGGSSNSWAATVDQIKAEYEKLSQTIKVVLISNPMGTSPVSRLPFRTLNPQFQDVDFVTLVNQAWRHHDPSGPYQDSTGSLLAIIPQFTAPVFAAAEPFGMIARPPGGRGTLIPRGSRTPIPPPTSSDEARVLVEAVNSINSMIKKGWQQVSEHDLIRRLPDGSSKESK